MPKSSEATLHGPCLCNLSVLNLWTCMNLHTISTPSAHTISSCHQQQTSPHDALSLPDAIMESCPVCNQRFLIEELPEHVQLHFLDDEHAPSGVRPPAAAAAHPSGQFDAGANDYLPEDGSTVRCPMGCGALILLEDLDSHEEAHRLEELESQHRSHQQEQEAAEFEKLQMKFGFSDKRPGKCFRCGEEGHWSRDCPSNPAAQASRARQPLTTDPAELSRVQQPDPGLRQQQGVDVISMLEACFQSQQKPRTTVYLSGPVTFCSRGAVDAGWGCGYRNIQMQASHQLLTSAEHQRALFGGAGFIPDIAALQAWLEVAWQAGFDPGGAAMFGSAVQCTRKWIGTTEAAAMLRYFGCRALIVDFYGKVDQAGGAPTLHEGVACDLCGKTPIIGVRYKSYSTPDFDVCSSCRASDAAQQHAPFHETGSGGARSSLQGAAAPPAAAAAGRAPAAALPALLSRDGGAVQQAGGAGPSSSNNQARKKPKQPGADDKRQSAARHQALAEWIWAYFSSPALQGSQPRGFHAGAAAAGHTGSSSSNSSSRVQGGGSADNAFSRLLQQQQQQRPPGTVVMTGKPPLYFQHEGHSRTVVGIERTLPAGPQQQVEYTLVVLDPGTPQAELINSLRSRDKWQMKVKRGMHSLARHSELQLLYVAPGVVPPGPERDALKKVVAAERYR